MSVFGQFMREEAGATAIEFGLIAAAISAVGNSPGGRLQTHRQGDAPIFEWSIGADRTDRRVET